MQEFSNSTSFSPNHMDYLDAKLRYKNLKNEVKILKKKLKKSQKHQGSLIEIENLSNELDHKKNLLHESKTYYHLKRKKKISSFFFSRIQSSKYY